MPTYEYKCDACGTTFEQFQSIMAAPLKKCIKCGKKRVHRLISGGGALIFKGSGFYITDYRSDSYKDSAKKDSGDAPAKSDGAAKTDAAKPAASTDKPAPKAETKPAKTEPKAEKKQ
jgi:putative FmdB family regulatory protein